MRRTEQITRVTKKKEASKELIAKIYFSRTQEGYLKKYGSDNRHILELGGTDGQDLSQEAGQDPGGSEAEQHRLQEVPRKRHIVKLRIEDVTEFEGLLELDNRKMLDCPSGLRAENNNLKQLNNDIIRIGFMMVLEKLADEKLNGFISESKCLK